MFCCFKLCIYVRACAHECRCSHSPEISLELEPPRECWDLNSGHLQELSMSLAAEPALHPSSPHPLYFHC